MIQTGNTIKVNYTGKHLDGAVFDSSEGKEPITFTVGSGQIIKGFDNAVIGKDIGDKITVNIQPSEAYGEINEELYVNVPNTQMPGSVFVGQSLQARSGDGITINVIVKKILESSVMIDGNHPFAGKELIFDIEIVDIVK